MTVARKPPRELSHHGVKGMKWGVRKADDASTPVLKSKTENLSQKLKNGDVLTLDGYPTSAMTKLIARTAPSRIEKYNGRSSFKIKDSSGKRVGEMFMAMDSPTSVNVKWIGINNSQRGNGYATAAMKAAIKHAKKQGLKAVTLEVPGNSPDARHIYDSLGFKEVYTPPDMLRPDPVWGGLTNMRLELG